ncbi:MAG TPA: class I SAM-dependent methyltransferase [Actinomycetota bacterium]|nr:class I SAM-dependent methyltransferase [Actinomycetota bacterium]
MDIVHPEVERYLLSLASSDDEPILLEMEQLAKDEGFPIVGRLCGRTIELLARAIGARRIFELGSGFGYSALWFARATGPSGEIHLTDLDPENERKALDFLGRAGVDGSVTFHVASALDAFAEASGDFDIVYCDIPVRRAVRGAPVSGRSTNLIRGTTRRSGAVGRTTSSTIRSSSVQSGRSFASASHSLFVSSMRGLPVPRSISDTRCARIPARSAKSS